MIYMYIHIYHSSNDSSDSNSHFVEHLKSNRSKFFVNFSNELGISSYRTAKIIIENLLGKNVSVSQVIEDPLLILDESLRRNVLECVMNDPLCSLESDQLKECTGKEFEALLLQQLQAKKMCFETEAELRNKGKPKTPDILFLVPMGVYDLTDKPDKVNRYSYM